MAHAPVDPPPGDPTLESGEALNNVADALLDAHRQAEQDGDEHLKTLIEVVLTYVGRRLAARLVANPYARARTEQIN